MKNAKTVEKMENEEGCWLGGGEAATNTSSCVGQKVKLVELVQKVEKVEKVKKVKVTSDVWSVAMFSCPQQLNRTHCPLLGLTKLTIRVFTTLQSDPREL